MQDSDYYSMMRKQYHNDSWESKLKMKQQAKAAAESSAPVVTENPPAKEKPETPDTEV